MERKIKIDTKGEGKDHFALSLVNYIELINSTVEEGLNAFCSPALTFDKDDFVFSKNDVQNLLIRQRREMYELGSHE